MNKQVEQRPYFENKYAPAKPAQKSDWFSQIRPTSIGFDSLFEHLDAMMKGSVSASTNYPPYNIVKVSDTDYYVEMAVAGFSKDDISINMVEDTLTISADKVSTDDPNVEVIHKGISNRYFSRTFRLAENIEVGDASMENGMLRVNFERIVPESHKPRVIEIN